MCDATHNRNTISFLDDDLLCSYIWPIQLFSFLCAFGLVLLIANRFKRVNTGQCHKKHLNFPLSIVPLVAFLLTLPTLILDQVIQTTNITELISNSHEDKNEFCFFNSSIAGTIVNYSCLQLPSLVTIIYNIDAYRKGVESLKKSSPEVLWQRATTSSPCSNNLSLYHFVQPIPPKTCHDVIIWTTLRYPMLRS